MMDLWQLPKEAVFGGESYPHRTDFRQMLKILKVLEDQSRPVLFRWLVALELFYCRPIPRPLEQEAMEYLRSFLCCGREDSPGPKLMDWDADAAAIIADVNAVAGKDIRCRKQLHWWSFLSLFHGIGQGQLSTRVAIRRKIAEGKPLEEWEREFCRQNPDVKLSRPETPEETQYRKQLEEMLR